MKWIFKRDAVAFYRFDRVNLGHLHASFFTKQPCPLWLQIEWRKVLASELFAAVTNDNILSNFQFSSIGYFYGECFPACILCNDG